MGQSRRRELQQVGPPSRAGGTWCQRRTPSCASPAAGPEARSCQRYEGDPGQREGVASLVSGGNERVDPAVLCQGLLILSFLHPLHLPYSLCAHIGRASLKSSHTPPSPTHLSTASGPSKSLKLCDRKPAHSSNLPPLTLRAVLLSRRCLQRQAAMVAYVWRSKAGAACGLVSRPGRRGARGRHRGRGQVAQGRMDVGVGAVSGALLGGAGGREGALHPRGPSLDILRLISSLWWLFVFFFPSLRSPAILLFIRSQ